MIEGNTIQDLTVYVKIYKEDILKYRDDPKAMLTVVNAAKDWVEDAFRLALKANGIEVAK